MIEHFCYLCGEVITPSQPVTGDHVVPVVFLGKKQPKIPGYDYAGRMRTHQACNNHFSDETFFKQAIHLLELAQAQRMHGVLQSAQHADITILPVTPDQIPRFTGREFKRFGFIDTRRVESGALKDPAFYVGKKKVNLFREAAQAAIAVKAKSAAALLVKRHIKRIPSSWKIYATPFEVEGSPDLSAHFGSTKPFSPQTRASIREVGADEWLVVYQHRSFLTFLLFVLHSEEVNPRQVLSYPDCEIYAFSGGALKDLAEHEWQVA